MPPLPRKARFCQIAAISLAGMLAMPAAACELPGDASASPLRRALTRVKILPETEAWQRSLPAGSVAQFVLLVDSPRRIRGRCYWPVEVRSGGALWKRFFVSPNVRRVLPEPAIGN
jgi:hypothetical protein